MSKKPDYNQLYEIAEGQAGYFTSAQAQTAGFSSERLSNNVKNGKIQRVARGIYRLAHFPATPFEDLFIAWLVTGPNSVISYESALAVYELSDVLPAEIHIIMLRSASRRRKGIRLHTNQLGPDETTIRAGLPVTTAERTIADIAISGLAEEHVRHAISDALRRGLTTREKLSTQAQRRGGRAKRIIQDALSRDTSP